MISQLSVEKRASILVGVKEQPIVGADFRKLDSSKKSIKDFYI